MSLELCIYQVFRPTVHIEEKGVGNCLYCLPDPKNAECKGYYKITIWTFYAIGKDDSN
ncbi:hypothetical protein MUP79_10230 [Candidatus Bathyarchaeota archaeon]|nr:hypothetical protein [Candidatus Bathyarchaeota archaeon]